MDPNAALAELRDIFTDIDTYSVEVAADKMSRAADLFDGLDNWLNRKGFLPDAWQR